VRRAGARANRCGDLDVKLARRREGDRPRGARYGQPQAGYEWNRERERRPDPVGDFGEDVVAAKGVSDRGGLDRIGRDGRRARRDR
jgi:hypothetical protein